MDIAAFDHPDRLNEDGTVTLRFAPSSWRAYNVSPDTYQTVNGDYWTEQEIEHLNEMSREEFSDCFGIDKGGVSLEYDDFTWDYNHAAIVRDFSETLCEWIVGELWNVLPSHLGPGWEWDEGRQEHVSRPLDALSGEVLDSWSPQYYNFTSDGFEMALTIHPETLRALTPDFDLDEWVQEHYRSMDGFMSFVTSRVQDDDWRADYDGQFRIEYLFAKEIDPYHERQWVMALAEAEWEVYSNNTKIEVREDRIRERQLYLDSEYTLAELEEWAREIAPAQVEALLP